MIINVLFYDYKCRASFIMSQYFRFLKININLIQSMASNNDDQDFLDIVPDPTVKQILRKQISQVAFSDEKFNKKMQRTKQTQNQINIIQRPLDGFTQLNNNNEYEDYQAELNPYKRDRMYEFIEPEKFKKIGYSSGTAIRKPIFRMTDLYLPPNDRVQKVIDRIFKQKIFGRHSAVAQLESQFDNTQQLQKIYNQWETKQDYDQFENAKNDLDQNDLEEIVVNLGDKKENYFLLMKNNKQKRRVEQYLKKPVKNLPVANPFFLKNFRKAVTQLSQINKFVEQFQSSDDSNDREQQKINFASKINKKVDQNQPVNKLFGTLKFNNQKSKKYLKEKSQNQSTCIDPLSFPLVDQAISLDVKHKHQRSFNQELIKYYSYSNNQIVSGAHKGPIQNLNRIQYNLANPQFFLPKLHIALQRQQDFSKVKGVQGMKQQGGLFGKATFNNLSQINKSKISDSLFTGNRQAQFSKPSMMQGSGQQIYPLLQDQQQTIQKRIQMEMRNIYKQPLHHSQVAVKFDLVRFTLDQNQFFNFHRNQFHYQYEFDKRTPIKPLFFKSRKIKPKDLIINTEMKNSNIKYSKRDSFSLSEGQFIMIQYIQQHPLALSNVGMCERMFIQVNYQEMLQKISQDMIKHAQIDDFQQMRDNPNKNINNININGGNTFERKCQLWRDNIKQTFGQNGKLFLWQPKMAGKLIGSPQGLGVGVMESNLSTYPIVKKKINPRDFLLVRQGNKWYIRKIQHAYVAGQVQPKKKIFNPDSREYIVFKTNYQKAFMRKQISMFGSVNFDHVKRNFSGQSQASLKKALKAIRATSNDNKNYTIIDGVQNFEYQLTTEDICLYERMQKSICLLKQVGIIHIRNNQKMKNVLKEFNKRHIQSLEKFALSRMIKDQLLLTSWYLTDSFSKFKIKSSKIQIVGMADPTNGRGGYSFINKPQKQRTAREDMQQKNQKPKVSGTNFDLRKLKTGQTRQYLISRGHKQQQLKGKGRWSLVCLMRKQQNTQFARKERQTKPQKAENEKRQISRVFNRMLSYLNGQETAPIFNYNAKKKITLEQLMQKERNLWMKTKDRILKGDGRDSDDGSQQGFDEDDFDKQGNDEQF